ncbi:MAG: hypothetical protein VB957_13190 [Pseudomonadales bacterium]|mgnify:CR=1 FL=1|jgi:hypothetical protein
MASGVASYMGGAIAGFAMGLLAMLVYLPWEEVDLLESISTWLVLNMGQSIWPFGTVLLLYSTNLIKLRRLISDNAAYKHIVQLDQLSDVWIHLFIGIGVIWTAIGMRSALSTTLDSPDALTNGAGEILSRLVDGGILLALTTTIVGAIGGYLMQLTKTFSLGASLTGYYHDEERGEFNILLDRIGNIESLLCEGPQVSSKADEREALAENA